jgi:very-short-patch-repair endonuclease
LIVPFLLQHSLEMAAVLAGGPGAVVSHLSAAYLYKLLPFPAQPGPVHITVPGMHIRRLENVRVHRAQLRHWEFRERHNIPLTAPVRTILDLAGCATDAHLEAAVAEACALRVLTIHQLSRAIGPGRRGAVRLRALLDAGPKRTRSTPERILLAALRAAGIDGFLTNERIGRWEADFYWPSHCLVVEVDAYSTHSSPTAFERDRRKDAELGALGLEVQRFSANRVGSEVGAVVAWIRDRLSRT